MSRTRLVLAIAAALLAPGARAQPKEVTIPATLETVSPLQRDLRAAFEKRAAEGLPVPASTTYTYEVIEGAPPAADGAEVRSLSAAEAGRTVTIVSRTVLAFDGPEQAGYDLGWPRLVLRSAVLPGAPTVLDGDYTEVYRAYAEQQVPRIWEAFEFGREPRTFTIEETTSLTFPEGSTAASALALALRAAPLASGATVDQILLGFTFAGPNIDNTVKAKESIPPLCLPWWLGGGCTPEVEFVDFEAGFRLIWAFGLRLPADVAMSGPLELASGSSETFYSNVMGADWTEGQYSSAGVGAFAGNEFVLTLDFFAGVKAELFGVDACVVAFGVPCYKSLYIDESSTFATPFGRTAYFDIDPLRLPLYGLGTEDLSFEFGLSLQPLIGSDRITASVRVAPGGSASLNGPAALTYQEPGLPVGLSVNACIAGGESREASIELTDFRYWFTRFLIDVGVYGTINLVGLTFDAGKPVYTFDLSKLLDGRLSLGRHMQCSGLAFTCQDAGPDDVVALTATVVDAAPPVTTLAIAGTEGKGSWYRSDLELTLAAIDLPTNCDSGVAATEYWLAGLRNAYAAPFTLGTEGVIPFQYRSTDRDGVVEALHDASLKIDKTKPIVEGAATTPANEYGWYDHDVTVHFTATDALSGVDVGTVTPDALLSEGANQSATGSALDLAGNAASATVGGINVDETPPSLLVASPQATAYQNTATVAVAWSADAAISGVARESGAVDGVTVANGEPIALVLFSPGSHVAYVEVMDRAKHVVDDTVTFEVTVDLPGLFAAQQRVCELDWINKYGICNSLEAKLLAALDSTARADLASATGQLGAFLNELDAQWNKAVNPQAYELLRADALYVLAHLG